MIRWFARNGVAANLLMLVIVLGGLASIYSIKVELFPQFSLDRVLVSVPFRGASPEEVEEQIVKRIEEEIQDVEGIKEIISTAVEGLGSVSVEVEKGYDPQQLTDDIKSRVDAISTFPVDAERPIVQEILIKREVMGVVLYGDADERTLKELAERAREDILALPGITQVEVDSVRDYEIAIEVSEQALREFGLTFDDVLRAVQDHSIDIPGGNIKTPGGEILLRTQGQAYRRDDFIKIPLLEKPDGTRVTVGDVATVNDGFIDETLVTTFNGKPSAELTVFEVGDQNPLVIAEQVNDFIADYQAELPPGITIESWRNFTHYLWGRLNMLLSNGAIGLLLVFAVLTLFLRPSLAFWVSLGIPISFLGTFLVMPWIGVSVNLISLFAFILVLGIVVDDAIVVGESVFSEFQKNGPGVESAIRGAHEVATPVTFAVLTSAVAFTPLLFLPGFTGKFLSAIPLIVIPTLLFSLVESKLILPYHLSLAKVGDRKERETMGFLRRTQRSIADGLENLVEKRYKPVASVALHNRYLTLASFIVILLIAVASVRAGWVKLLPFPAVPSDYIQVNLIYPDGTPLGITERGLERVRTVLDELIDESQAAGRPNPVENINVNLGVTVSGGGPGGSSSSSAQSHLASIVVELRKSEDRADEDNAVTMANKWRDSIGNLPGIKELTFDAEAAGGQGSPIDVQVTSRNPEDLRAIANAIKSELESYQGVFDIRDNLKDGQREIKLNLKPEAEVLGLTQQDLGRQVRAAFFGLEAQRVQRGRDDVRVMVRYPRDQRESIADLENLRIRTPDGREVPFYEVAEADIGTGFAEITRVDRNRVVNIRADINKDDPSVDQQLIQLDLIEEKLPVIMANYPGARYVMEGEFAETQEGNESLYTSLIAALFVMYAMLAIPFKSYLQPLIIMSVIPFGLVGAIFGHWLLGFPLSRLSMFGLVALTGVVVNDSLVLVDFINRRVRDGMPILEAVRDAGARRFRPIMLTTLTTFCGLAPILFETSLQAQFLIPMAVSLSFGIVFATTITLLLVPSLYLILEDIKRICGISWRWMLAKPASNASSP